jgi:hypothetical protein
MIESISTGDKVCELIPYRIKKNNAELTGGLIDTVSGALYSVLGASFGYDA